jgi:hypothetical protein
MTNSTSGWMPSGSLWVSDVVVVDDVVVGLVVLDELDVAVVAVVVGETQAVVEVDEVSVLAEPSGSVESVLVGSVDVVMVDVAVVVGLHAGMIVVSGLLVCSGSQAAASSTSTHTARTPTRPFALPTTTTRSLGSRDAPSRGSTDDTHSVRRR